MVKIHIDYAQEYSEDLLALLNDQTEVFELFDINEDEEGGDTIQLIPHFGKYTYELNEVSYNIEYIELSDIIREGEKITSRKIIIECTHSSDRSVNIKAIKDLINQSKKSSRPELEDNIRIYISNGGRWEKLNLIQKRSLDSVFIDKKNEIVTDLDKFMNDEKIYIERGIKYKRNYLLYGPPGTGKTSFISAIASKYNLDIFMVNFGGNVCDSSFIKLISKLPERSLLVLEDIDCLFESRESKTSVSFSTILNILDGFACKNRLITFMTTNYKDKLDSALTRPGRIDYILELKYASKTILNEMYRSYFDDENFEQLYTQIKSKRISTAAFHKFLFDFRDSENIMKHVDILSNLAEQYMSYQNMYL
jgi:SpoVK/Ycf46/Vps4 family AAA+-type ATPase